MVRNTNMWLPLFLVGILISCKNNDDLNVTKKFTISTPYYYTATINSEIDSSLEIALPPEITSPSMTALPLRVTLTPSGNVSPENAHQISEFPKGYIGHIFWSKDSRIIFFWLDTNLWAYELATTKTQKMYPSHIWMTVYPTQSPTPFPEILLDDLSGMTEIMTLSPSGQKALVFNSITPHSTPKPGENGVRGSFSGQTDVWLWEQGSLYKLGAINACSPNTYNWTANENYISIQAPLAPSPCSSNGWLVNTQAQAINDILPIDVYGGVSEFGDFTIDQDHILLIHRNRDNDGAFVKLHLMELGSLHTSVLDVPRITYPIAWIDSNRLLISHAEQLGDIRTPSVFNIQTGLLEDLQLPLSVQNMQIDPIALSPDKKWITFVAQEIPFEKSNLWLMPLQE